ncbi:histidinol-phosphate transaminase [Anaerocolumna sedimenticola]|uniref:Histidinol-phosphate aminotransferase n=1 Tax=Anaerocolumna sedimenticola TaxID=2696063 RepID=A0A6P1TGZ0_9FIRM|nr:histidinol-phosphate transaminase [Anaerocolumna sedimenticola]QHQ59693.1 histidinol-phosphate transaminase [Anaerocolumna sedimenticola]
MKAWENNIRKIVPYTPGEQPDSPNMIKLNTNENPYPPALGVQKAIREFQMERLKLYPDPTSNLLVKALADYYKLEENQVFVGVGSDDVLAMAFMTFFNSDKPILFPDITYSFYDVWADLFRIPYVRPALDVDFRIKKEDYYRENGGIVIANPNAPTSIYEDVNFIRDIVEHNQESIVIVDEAYIDFGGKSSLELIKEFDNLLVVQTFSKSRSMAGMRIGYAMGNPALIKAINDVKYSYNSYTMNQTSLYYGVEAVKDETYFKETLEKIITTREWVKEELKKLEFSFPDSKTNFIFASHKFIPAAEIFNALREENIFVRYFNKPGINNYLRITIGTDEEMKQLLKALEQIINRI